MTILNMMLHQSSHSVLLPPLEEIYDGEMQVTQMTTENINPNTSVLLKQGMHATVNGSNKDFMITDE